MQEVKSPLQQKPYEILEPYVPKLKALWHGYSMRKLYKHLVRQSRPNHFYFSRGEVQETLKPSCGSSTQEYANFTYKQGGVYVGEWRGGFRHGYGAMVWPDGAKYEGNWSYSRPFGAGKFVHVDGEIYNGRWKKYWVAPRDTFGSEGTMENWKSLATDGFLWLWIKQEIFKIEPPQPRGSFSRTSVSRRNTASTMTDKLQEITCRVESNVKKIGELKVMCKNMGLPDNNKEFKQRRYENGVVYIGQWKGGKREGYGKQTWANGDVYEGLWKDDKQHGMGRHGWSTGNSYFGEFVLDQKEGVGDYSWCDGSYYVGEWRGNKMHGVGSHKWNDGKEYVGEWANGARQGIGQMIYQNGSRYEGEFTCDRPHGFGILFQAEGRVLKGCWENGKFVEAIYL